MTGFEEFDQLCADWKAAHPGEECPAGDLFANWLAGRTGEVVIGGPVSEPPSVVAVPDR